MIWETFFLKNYKQNVVKKILKKRKIKIEHFSGSISLKFFTVCLNCMPS